MIPAFLYKYIYFLIITVLTLSEVQRLRSLNEKEGSLGSLFLCLFMVFFIGFRPVSGLFVDMVNYAHWWGGDWQGIRKICYLIISINTWEVFFLMQPFSLA